MDDPRDGRGMHRPGRTGEAHHEASPPGHGQDRSNSNTIDRHGRHAAGHKGGDHPGGHHEHMIADFRRRLWISLGLSVPVLALSPMIQDVLGYAIAFPGDRVVLSLLASLVYVYGGWPFLKGLARELRRGLPGMMTLIGLAITVAYGYSAAVVLGVSGRVFFWELVTLIDVMLLGHWIEMRSIQGASRALEELAKLMPAQAHRLESGGRTREVRIEELSQGDRVLVKSGEKVPVDGRVVDGESEVNESLLTGEARPVPKQAGDKVLGGSINAQGALTVDVSTSGENSYLGQVMKLVREAGRSKSRAQDFADRAAFGLTLIAVTAGAATLAVWLSLGREFVFALERTVTVMVITCPHALGLAVPLVIAAVTSLSAKHGLLIRKRAAFESAQRLDVVIFDKTGTLTRGEFGVSDIVSLGGWDEDEILRTAASLESRSEHTIARGIVRAAEARRLDPPSVERFQALPGSGAKAVVAGREVYIGNRAVLDLAGADAGDLDRRFRELAEGGRTVVVLAAEGRVQALLGLSDRIRDESPEAVKMLQAMGYRVAMITGDNRATAQTVAGQLGVDEFFAEVLPEQKSERIKQLQRQGKRVAMVGDGVNDAPALAQADVGIAIGAGTDVAVETADVVLTESDPRSVVDVIRLSRLTRRKTVQNLAWATGYNAIAIPLAAGVLYSQGILLPPAAGALVMSLSTVIVAVNARLLRFEGHGRV